MCGSALLVLDAATGRTVVALRRGPGAAVDDGSSSGPERGAAALGTRIVALLAAAGTEPRDLAAVGVGTGPGSFTGLRVALATAKTLAWSLRIPLVGIPTSEALRRAAMAPSASAVAATDAAATVLGDIAVVQAAGARDHYLALAGEGPRLVPPGTDLAAAIGRHPVIALDADPSRLVGCAGPGGADPLAAGMAARDGLGAALLAILDERLATGAIDDIAELVPAYVALPRGIAAATGSAWSPELR